MPNNPTTGVLANSRRLAAVRIPGGVELEELSGFVRARLAGASSRLGPIGFVAAASGFGKSRLLREFRLIETHAGELSNVASLIGQTRATSLTPVPWSNSPMPTSWLDAITRPTRCCRMRMGRFIR